MIPRAPATNASPPSPLSLLLVLLLALLHTTTTTAFLLPHPSTSPTCQQQVTLSSLSPFPLRKASLAAKVSLVILSCPPRPSLPPSLVPSSLPPSLPPIFLPVCCPLYATLKNAASAVDGRHARAVFSLGGYVNTPTPPSVRASLPPLFPSYLLPSLRALASAKDRAGSETARARVSKDRSCCTTTRRR